MKQMDDNIGYVLKKLEDMGQLDKTIVAFTTTTAPRVITFPDGGTTPFRGGKLTTWEGGMRAPLVVRWPGVIKPRHGQKEMFAALDWVPTLVNIAGRPKGDALKKRIEAGQYPGIVKTTLDGVDQRDYLEGKTDKSAREVFFYYTGAQAVGGAVQELEVLLHDGARHCYRRAHGSQHLPLDPAPEHPARSVETTVAPTAKSLLGYAGALAARVPRISTTGTFLPSANCYGSRSSSPMWRSRRCRIRRATTSRRYWTRSRGRGTVTRANDRVTGAY